MRLVLVVLAVSAVASADPPKAPKPQPARSGPRTMPPQWVDSAPRTIVPELSPPGLTPTIRELDCSVDPFENLRNDCSRDGDDEWHDSSANARWMTWPDGERSNRADQSAGRDTSSDWAIPTWRR